MAIPPGTVKLNHRTAGKLLREKFVEPTNALADAIAAEAGDEAIVEHYTTDRSAAAVMVPTLSQITDGALTRAAGALGLEVRAKP